MSDAIIALIAVGSILTYVMGAGVTYAIGKHRDWRYEYDVGPNATVALWPLALPFMMTSMFTSWLLTPKPKLPTARVVDR